MDSTLPTPMNRLLTASNRCLMNDDTRRALFAALSGRGLRECTGRLAFAATVLKRPVATFTFLSEIEARDLLNTIERR